MYKTNEEEKQIPKEKEAQEVILCFLSTTITFMHTTMNNNKAMNMTEAAIAPYVKNMNALVSYRKAQLDAAYEADKEYIELRKEAEKAWPGLSREAKKFHLDKKDKAWQAYNLAHAKAFHAGNAIILHGKAILTIVGNNIVPFYLGKVGPKTCEKIKVALSSYLVPIFGEDGYSVTRSPDKELCVYARVKDMDLGSYVSCDSTLSVENPFGEVVKANLETPNDIEELLRQKELMEKKFEALHAEVKEKIFAIYEECSLAFDCSLHTIKNIELV